MDKGSFIAATEKDKEGEPKSIPAWNWRSATGPNQIYIELFSWPSGDNFHLNNVPREVTGAYMLADKNQTPPKVAKSTSGVDIHLPGKGIDPIATVLVLSTK